MKDAARLLGYFGITILFGAVTAPILFWLAQWCVAHGAPAFLGRFDFESFFHRALLLGAILFLWPLLRSLGIKNRSDFGLSPNPSWRRDMGIGFVLSTLPVLSLAAVLVSADVYAIRDNIKWNGVASASLTAVVVSFLEEGFFRGLLLGILLRNNRVVTAILLSSGIYSIIHFLKAPEHTTTIAKWNSGFDSLAHAFDQFGEPMLLLAGFTTLFLIGVILAYARVRTRSLWLPIGLHAGWILSSSTFAKIAHRQMVALPWLGKNLLIGIVPLCVCLLSWLCLKGWLRYARQA